MEAMGMMVANFSAQEIGTGATSTTYIRGDSTLQVEAKLTADAEVTNPSLGAWFRSFEARRYLGKWVMLSPELTVIDSKATPGPLLSEHPEEISPLIVFVDPEIFRK